MSFLPLANIFDATPMVLAAFAVLALAGFLLIGLRKRTAGVTLILVTVVGAAVYLAVFALLFVSGIKSFN